MAEENLVEVYRAKNSPSAHVLKAALEEAGITAVVEGEMLQGALGELPLGWSSSPRVLVETGDAPKALEIIRQNEPAPISSGDVCLSCGATLDEDEEACPKCGWSYRNHSADEEA